MFNADKLTNWQKHRKSKSQKINIKRISSLTILNKNKNTEKINLKGLLTDDKTYIEIYIE